MIDRCVKHHLSKDIRSTDSVSIHEDTGGDMIVVSNVDLDVSEVLELVAVSEVLELVAVSEVLESVDMVVVKEVDLEEVLELIEPDNFVSVTDVDVSIKVLELIEPEN